MLTVVTPAFNEALNLPVLYENLRSVLESNGIEWEWIIVDDHSIDKTFRVISDFAAQDVRVRGLRFSRNFGSHAAIRCGLDNAHGDCAVMVAADLQNPPELIPQLVAEWRKGAKVVMATRSDRGKEVWSTWLFAKLYYILTRNMEGFKNRPEGGMDFCLLDRQVIDAVGQFSEIHVGVMSLISWMGYKQAFVPHARPERLHGKSGWSFVRKVQMALDSITAFSYAPIRWITYIGVGVACSGFLYALYIILNRFRGSPPEGWASLMVVILVMGGLQMVMMGILGEYLWRALDEARDRPRYLIEDRVGKDSVPA